MGQATATFTPPTAGSYTIEAIYLGSAVFGERSASPFTQVVLAPTATSTTVKASATAAAFGTPVTFTAVVTPASGTGTPTGTVTFLDGGTTLGTVSLAGGQASLTTAMLSRGKHSVKAVYNGAGNFTMSTSAALTVTIN